LFPKKNPKKKQAFFVGGFGSLKKGRRRILLLFLNPSSAEGDAHTNKL
jgi:hypothetical protein